MSKRRIASAAIVVAATAVLLGLLLRPREPAYQGRLLSEWLDEYNRAGATNHFAEVNAAIRAMGINCLPILLTDVYHQQSRIGRGFWELAKRQSVVHFSAYGEEAVVNPSLIALHVLGDNARPLLPELAKRAANPAQLRSTWLPLLAIGQSALPVLADLCNHTNRQTRIMAANMIAEIDAGQTLDVSWHGAFVNGKPLVAVTFSSKYRDVQHELTRLMTQQTNRPVRIAALEASSRLKFDPLATDELKQALSEAAQDPDPAVRHAAAGPFPDSTGLQTAPK